MNNKKICIIYDRTNQNSESIIDQVYSHFCYDLSDTMAANLGFEIQLYDIASDRLRIKDIDPNTCCLSIIIITDAFFHEASKVQNTIEKLRERGTKTLLISLCKNRNLVRDINLLLVDPEKLESNISRILCVIAQKLCGEKITIFLSYYREEGNDVCRDFIKYALDIPGYQEFIDVKCIEFGAEIQKEIELCIKDKNSVVLCLRTPRYSERFWGMTELLLAKEHDVPIVIADCLEGVEQRSNPNAGNVPVIRLNLPLTAETVTTAMLLLTKEYLRKSIFSHAPDQENATLYLWRGPELADLTKAKLQNFTSIVYPAPPICKCETEYYHKLCSNVDLLLDNQVSLNTQNNRKKICISFSEGEPRKDAHPSFLKSIAAEILRYLICKDYEILYGGDWRRSGFTEQIRDFIEIYRSKHNGSNASLTNYFVNLHDDEVNHIEQELYSYGSLIQIPYASDPIASLSNMRERLITDADAVIVLGGKHTSENGITSGIAEEVALALTYNKPIYLLGATGGATGAIVDMVNGDNFRFTSSHTDNAHCQQRLSEINRIITQTTVEGISSINGLSPEENHTLFTSKNINLLLRVIFNGIERALSHCFNTELPPHET